MLTIGIRSLDILHTLGWILVALGVFHFLGVSRNMIALAIMGNKRINGNFIASYGGPIYVILGIVFLSLSR